MEWSAHMRESGKFLLVEFEEFLALESGIQLKESGIPLRNGIQNPNSTDIKSEVSSWNPESLAWIQDCLALPYMGREWAGE